ncbi:class I SAM-dependent methyltransferase [Mycolicibacterium monacense]|uniref:SAM-dependent methyltransferase n=1 Tax=Mycolicibacterium monacense TaxID=85693 RepID=A0AAD1N027_MYCMB|nr:class I SAM-dependent methyltransferase [Mycolicibacterium monacense]MDA4103799.1 SAM-dependent methyltransferase [Mycolicibacterium monacense DSM 44395]OBB71353.1 SAM-dependent methyltransferase [Mycolicibacterium monacense]OBF51579.1 SAM-dependent methyltransferase [Mycolicibacterium monacense]ORB23953.1 SAM-dependent methyltransferase [Mycolicibacterium monacense DSM 44395]QHP85783.1 class I SAM-dependent methyltransferase [Mycolicibacterium monacense DSM 44395]
MTEHPTVVNHHAGQPGFGGLVGVLFAVVFLLTGRGNARLAADVAAVSADDRVVDVGCGPGTAARLAARRGARVTGVDPSDAMLRVARAVTRRRTSVTWVRGGAEALPVPDASATVVWALATVHHWPDVGAALTEIRRVLSPGGRLLVVERQVQPGATGFASHGWTAQQAETFAALCRSAGLTDVGVTGRGRGRRAVWTVRGVRPAGL